MPSKLRLSIILPCYNEQESIAALIFDYFQYQSKEKDVEIIIVDNGSTDGTGQVIAETLQKLNNDRLKSIKVDVNKGYGFGVLAGLKQAGGEFLAWSHADQQCPPEDVFRVLSAMERTGHSESCFGKGVRVNDRGRASLLTNIQELLSTIVLGKKMKEINAQPKVFHRRLYEQFKMPPHGYELDVYIYFKALIESYQIVEVDVLFLERKFGQSKWSFSLKSKLSLILSNLRYLLFLRMNRRRI